MEAQTPIEDTTKKGFFSYVFNFDDTNRAQCINLFQYTFIAVPLVLILLKVINYFTPEVDETRGTLEIVADIIISVSWILLTIWFINKIIRYIPTFSKMPYPLFNETNFIIPLLIVLFTMNTKLGNKLNVLVERVVDVYDGKVNLKNSNNNVKNKDLKSTQPIANNKIPPPPSGVDAVYGIPSGSNINLRGTQNNMVESEGKYTHQLHKDTVQSQQHNFNNDFAGPSINPLLATENARQAGMEGFSNFEPLAANDVLGGSFGSAF